LTSIKDAECDPVAGLRAAPFVTKEEGNLDHQKFGGLFLPSSWIQSLSEEVSESSGFRRQMRQQSARRSPDDEPSLEHKLSVARGWIKPTQG